MSPTSPRRSTPLALLHAALLLLAAGPAAAVEKPEGKAVQHDGYALTLPTGLRIVAYQLAGAPRGSVGVSWLAGSLDDPPGKEGLAHLVEHLAFRCRVAGGTVWQRLQGDGVGFNAYTVHDATVYFEIGKSDQLRTLLALEAERMKDPLFGVTEEDFVTERDVVVSELRERSQRFDVIGGFETLQGRLFGSSHPYGRSIGGTEESVRRISWADVKTFVGTFYRPERAILTVVSPRPARDAAKLALDQLGTWATGPTDVLVVPVRPATRPAVPIPPDPPHELLVLRGAVPRPVLLVSFQVPGDTAEAGPLGRAAASALWQVMGRRLIGMGDYEKIASFNAFYSGLDGAGMLTAAVELEEGIDPKKVLEAIRDNLLSIEDGNSDFRMRAKVTLQSRDFQLMATYMSIENLDAATLAAFTRATGKLDAIQARQLQILSLNQTIETYWHDYLKRSRSAAVVVLPAKDASEAAAPVGDLSSRMTEKHQDRDLDFTPRRAVTDVARPPGLDGARRFKLKNGLTVVLGPRTLLPLAEVTLVVPTDLAGLKGSSTAMPEFTMAFAGTAADSRWGHTARLGMQGFTRPELEGVTFMRRGTSATLRQVLEDVERLTHNLEFSRSRATFTRDRLVKDRVAALKKPEVVAQVVQRSLLYPDHPYGAMSRVWELERLSREQAEQWASTQLRPELATLIVVGDFEPGATVEKLVTDIFGSWSPGRSGPRLEALAPLPTSPQVALADRPGAKLAELRLSYRIPEAVRADEAAVEAVSRRLGQSLMSLLREEAGTTYGVRTSVQHEPYASVFQIETMVDATVAGDALVRLAAGVESLAQTPLPAAAVARVQWLLARDFGGAFDTVAQVSDALREQAFRGLPADHWEKKAAAIASLSAARIQAVAKALLGQEVILVVGDAKVLGPQLKATGFDFEPVKSAP